MPTGFKQYCNQLISSANLNKYTPQECFNKHLGQTNIHKYTLQEAVNKLLIDKGLSTSGLHKYNVLEGLNKLVGNPTLHTDSLTNALIKYILQSATKRYAKRDGSVYLRRNGSSWSLR